MPKNRQTITTEKATEIKRIFKQFGFENLMLEMSRTESAKESLTTKKSKGLISVIQVCMAYDGSYSYSQFLDKAIKLYCKKILETNVV